MELYDFDKLPEGNWAIKAGFDPTSTDLHLGHAVLLRQLRKWQDKGHTVVMIVGDYTARIGDPTGKNSTRPILTNEQISNNAKTYMDQAFLILDKNKTIVRKNSEWLDKMSASDLLSIFQSFTLSQLLTRNDFSKRMDEGKPLGLHELIYPILQGLDSLEIKSNLELGGSDQLFNLMMGRKIQAINNQPEQAVAVMPLLIGLDGVNKMSKSLNNHIPLLDSPFEMFSKIMSIPDTLLENYSKCFDIKINLNDPFNAKKEIGLAIVSFIKGDIEAKEAKKAWEERFSKRIISEDLKEVNVENQNIIQLLVSCGFVTSKTMARQKIKEGAVKLNGEVVDMNNLTPMEGVLSLGRRHMVRLVFPKSKKLKY